jgi:uncharacterized protein (DUF58 family)
MSIFVLLLVTGLAVGLQAAVFGLNGVSRIRYTRQFQVPECYAGDTIELVEVIENHKWLPVPWIRVESMIDAALRFRTEEAVHIDEGRKTQYHKSLFTLGPYRRIRRRHKITCVRRGVYRLSGVTVTAGDLFGMVERTRRYPVEAELVVYPQVTALDDVPLPHHGWQGDVTVRRWLVDDPFTVAGVRDYRSGDPMKSIHWKATARTGSLQVYRREFTAERRLMVMLNVEDRETTRDVVHHEDLIERGISYAATLVSDAIRRGVPAGFGHNGYRKERADGAERTGGLLGQARGGAGRTNGGAGVRSGSENRRAEDARTAGSDRTDDARMPAGVGRVPAGGGREHLMAILEEMARIELRCRMLFHDFLEDDCRAADEKRDYVLITAHLSEPLRERIRRLEEAGHSVQVLHLEREAEEVPA